MFKLFFRTITLIIFLILVIVGLAFWKGGEPFRWLGNKTEFVGKTMTDFGDFVDKVILGGQQVHETIDQLQETFSENDKKNEKQK